MRKGHYAGIAVLLIAALMLASAGLASASNETNNSSIIVMPTIPDVNTDVLITGKDLEALSSYQSNFLNSIDSQHIEYQKTQRIQIISEHDMLKSLFDNMPKIISAVHPPAQPTAVTSQAVAQSQGTNENSSYNFMEIIFIFAILALGIVAIAGRH